MLRLWPGAAIPCSLGGCREWYSGTAVESSCELSSPGSVFTVEDGGFGRSDGVLIDGIASRGSLGLHMKVARLGAGFLRVDAHSLSGEDLNTVHNFLRVGFILRKRRHTTMQLRQRMSVRSNGLVALMVKRKASWAQSLLLRHLVTINTYVLAQWIS